jgi:hypothetical protein
LPTESNHEPSRDTTWGYRSHWIWWYVTHCVVHSTFKV